MRRRKQRKAGTPKPMLLCKSSALLGETIPREKIADTGEEAVAYATQVRPEKNRTISQLFKHMIATNPQICVSKRLEQSELMLRQEEVCGSWGLEQSRLVLCRRSKLRGGCGRWQAKSVAPSERLVDIIYHGRCAIRLHSSRHSPQASWEVN